MRSISSAERRPNCRRRGRIGGTLVSPYLIIAGRRSPHGGGGPPCRARARARDRDRARDRARNTDRRRAGGDRSGKPVRRGEGGRRRKKIVPPGHGQPPSVPTHNDAPSGPPETFAAMTTTDTDCLTYLTGTTTGCHLSTSAVRKRGLGALPSNLSNARLPQAYMQRSEFPLHTALEEDSLRTMAAPPGTDSSAGELRDTNLASLRSVPWPSSPSSSPSS